MQRIIPSTLLISGLLTGCQHTARVSPTEPRAPAAAAPAQSTSARTTQPILITAHGVHTSPNGLWRIEISAEGDRLHVSHIGQANGAAFSGTATTPISPVRWSAKPGWLVFIENDSRVWAYDGDRDLLLQTVTSDTSTSYGPYRFPCAVPREVWSRLTEPAQRAIKTDEH